MSGWQKIRTVATFEFLSTVKRPGYLIATFGMPVFMAAYAAVVAVPACFAEQSSRQPSVYGVVDQAGVLRLEGDLKGGDGLQFPTTCGSALEAAGQAQALDRAVLAQHFVFRPVANRGGGTGRARCAPAEGLLRVPKAYMSEGQLDVYSPDSVTMSGSDSAPR